ncbi:MAG: DUF58 domain-containing protein [Bryobacterales bacterium]|nr:DUF58 domain-containing protein [Bryobacterales bacterium]
MNRYNPFHTLWQWLRRWKSGVRHQVTWSGLAFTTLILLIGLAAFASANNLLFLLLAAMLSTMLVSGLVSRLSLAGLEVKLLLPEHVFAARRLPARIQLLNAKKWMPSFSIHLASSDEEESPAQIYFPIVPGGATLEALTTVYFRKRGLHGDSQYQFTTRFPFGFTERRVQVRLHREVLVYPSIDAQTGFEDLLHSLEGDMEAHFQGRGSDFYRIRPYEPTESARHVDWKATAHTGELQVREFAREEDNLVEVLLDLETGAAGEEWLERAIECCAFLCWRLASRNARLRFATQERDIRLPENGDIYTILKYLAQVKPLRARTVVYPHEETSFKIVFSLSKSPTLEAGWSSARILGRNAFEPPPAGSSGPGVNRRTETGTGADVSNRRR